MNRTTLAVAAVPPTLPVALPVALSLTLSLTLLVAGCAAPESAAPAEPPAALTSEIPAEATTGPSTSADADADAVPSYPLTVTDCDREVTLDVEPQSVLTIGQAAVSLLDAAGATGLVTARSGEFGAPLPAGLTDPPEDAEILDPADPSAEAILASGADVVVGYGLFAAEPRQLAQADVPVLTVSGECGHDAAAARGAVGFETVADDVRRFGEVFGTSDVAAPAADALDARVAELSATEPVGSAAWVYFFSSADGLSGYGGVGMAEAVLRGAGLENVYGSQAEPYLTLDVESLLEADPEWLVLSYGLYGESEEDARAQLLDVTGVADLTAVREDRIVLVPGTASEPSPRAVDGLEALVAATSDR